MVKSASVWSHSGRTAKQLLCWTPSQNILGLGQTCRPEKDAHSLLVNYLQTFWICCKSLSILNKKRFLNDIINQRIEQSIRLPSRHQPWWNINTIGLRSRGLGLSWLMDRENCSHLIPSRNTTSEREICPFLFCSCHPSFVFNLGVIISLLK